MKGEAGDKCHTDTSTENSTSFPTCLYVGKVSSWRG